METWLNFFFDIDLGGVSLYCTESLLEYLLVLVKYALKCVCGSVHPLRWNANPDETTDASLTLVVKVRYL